MGWSINPSSLASIDQNGVLSYQQHTSDTVYTISYSDDDCSATKSVTIKKCAPPPAECPASGGSDFGGAILMVGSFISGKEETEHPIAFHTGDTTFIGTPSFSYDGTIITNVQMGGIDAPPGYQWIDITHVANDGPERTGATVTISAPTANGMCTYNVSFTQQTKGADFRVSIEFGGQDLHGRSPFIDIIKVEECPPAGTTVPVGEVSVYNRDRQSEPSIYDASWRNGGGIVTGMKFTQNDENALTVRVWWDNETPLILDMTLNPSDPSERKPQYIYFTPGCGANTFNTDDYSDGRHTLHIHFEMG